MIGDRIRRLAFTIVLVTFLMSFWGCATYRQVALPGSEVEVGDETPHDVVVEGDSVRLRLESGETYFGTVTWLTDEKLGLDGLGNFGPSELSIPLDEIEQMELRNESSGRIEATWLLGVGIGLIGGFLWALSNTYGN